MKVAEMKINGKEVIEAKLNGQVVFRKKEGLVVNVNYNPSTTTSGSVTVTLTANKPIAVTNAGTWLKVNDYTYKKVYPSNNTQNATVTANNGEVIIVTITVKNIDKAPGISIKTGATETIGNATDGYTLISFKISDDVGLKEWELNGVITQVSNSKWGDINYISIKSKGAVEGINTLIVRDQVGNEKTITFKLIKG